MRNWCRSQDKVTDERFLSSYKSYHLGKYLALIGSVVFCVGLLTYFFLHTDTIPVVTLTISILGAVFFLLGAFFFLKAVYHTFVAQSRDSGSATNADLPPNPDRSYPSHQSALAIGQ